MKELWVKKSVYRRYLIKDEDIKEAKGILDYEPDRIDLIDNDLDLNSEIEYDDEKLYFPVTYNIEDLSKMNIVDKKDLLCDFLDSIKSLRNNEELNDIITSEFVDAYLNKQ